MNAGEITRLIRSNVQIFDINPLKDGFADDPDNQRDGTRIVDYENLVGRELARASLLQGYLTFTLEEDAREVCPNVGFRFVYEVRIIDPDTEEDRILMPFSRFRENQLLPSTWNATRRGKPQCFGFIGNTMYFDRYANKDYTIKMLCDKAWTEITARTDVPDVGINAMDHDILLIGGSAWLSMIGMNMPRNRNEFALQRAIKFEREYMKMVTELKQLNRNRYTQNMYTIFIDTGRDDYPFRR